MAKITPEKPKPRKVRQNLDIPKNMLRYKARKLQIALRVMDNLLASQPTQFSAKTYLDLLNEFEKVVNEIKVKGYDKRGMAEEGKSMGAPDMGEGTSAGVDTGVSANNPFTR